MKLSGIPVQGLNHHQSIYRSAKGIKEGYLLVMHPSFCLLNILMLEISGIAATTSGIMTAGYASALYLHVHC